MVTRNIRAFVARDWAAVRASKDAYWGERIARLGPLEGFRVADELRRQVLMRDPTWPDPESRRQDLGAHEQLAQRFRRASATRSC